jgi:DNA-3-methyladenine glycosylase I
MTEPEIVRCPWPQSALDIHYHDTEWGVPQHDDRMLFEFVILEGAQAGLSWSTILKKRGTYREAFDGFDAARIARYDQRKVAELLGNPGIVRNPFWRCGGSVEASTSICGSSWEGGRVRTGGLR